MEKKKQFLRYSVLAVCLIYLATWYVTAEPNIFNFSEIGRFGYLALNFTGVWLVGLVLFTK